VTSTSAFTAAGQLKFVGGVLYGNTDGSLQTAEFAIQVNFGTGTTALTANDIFL